MRRMNGAIEQPGQEARQELEADHPGNRAVGTAEGKGAIGGGDQLAGKRKALRLVAVEQRCAGSLLHHGGEFPRQIHGVADPGVHSLTAHGRVNVRRIANEKGASLAKLRDATRWLHVDMSRTS